MPTLSFTPSKEATFTTCAASARYGPFSTVRLHGSGCPSSPVARKADAVGKGRPAVAENEAAERSLGAWTQPATATRAKASANARARGRDMEGRALGWMAFKASCTRSAQDDGPGHGHGHGHGGGGPGPVPLPVPGRLLSPPSPRPA